MPWVEVPDISNVPGAFDPANDPYAAYADDVIASLDANVSGNQVIGRATFIATVRAWRTNQAALQKAILARMSVSQAETNAFLNAQNKVTSYLQKFVDASGWFLDAPIPLDVRADVDGTLKNLYGVLAEDLKDRLNAWDAKWNPPEANLFFDTLRAFSAGMQAGEEIAQEYRETMRSIVHGASRVAIGFVPFVGTGLDLCEAVTGKEWCMPSGRELTTGERIFSGIGFGVGKLVKVWKGVGSAAISGEGKLAAAGIVGLGPDVVEALAKARIDKWKTLTRGSITATEEFVNAFEKRAVLYVINKQDHKVLAMGDGVKEILGIEKNVQSGLSKSPDLLSVSQNGGLVVSEFKFTGKAGIDCGNAEAQLKNAMLHLDKKDLAEGVERVQLIIPKGAALVEGTKPKGTTEMWNFTVDAQGYLLKNGLKVTMPGNPNVFVSVVEI